MKINNNVLSSRDVELGGWRASGPKGFSEAPMILEDEGLKEQLDDIGKRIQELETEAKTKKQ